MSDVKTTPAIDLKRYHSENANRYADLMGMLQDLNEAALHFHMGELATEPSSPSYGNQLVAKAHWLAGATLYSRCFRTEGRPFKRETLYASLRPDLANFHLWLLRAYDRQSSQSENLFEEVIPTIGRMNGDTGVGYIGVAVLNPRASVFHQCTRFVKEVVRLAKIEAERAFVRFQNEAETLDDQFLESLPSAPKMENREVTL